jgi:FMN-dependent oxidoreductase (nitrilotriacetate monooxygenase family)
MTFIIDASVKRKSCMSRMIMGVFLGYGHGPRGWDDPKLRADYDWRRPELFQDLALVCERGCLDLMIFADVLGIPEAFKGSQETPIKFGLEGICHDPIPLLSMIAAKAENLGLASTISTTFYPPFLAARLWTTLDHLTRGRVAWNVVTTSNQSTAKNFGLEHLPLHDERYDIADEYMRLCYQLWSSWDRDAVTEPRDDIVFADPKKVRRIFFQSDNFKCAGPLTAVPSPQGRPVIVQAGTSDKGREFASRHAELVICSNESFDEMKFICDDIRQRAVRNGRQETDLKVLFTFNPMVLGPNESEVARKEKLFEDVGHQFVEAGLAKISRSLGIDVSEFDLDKPIPHIEQQMLQSGRSLLPKYYSFGRTPTLREVAAREATKETFQVRGTYARIAERLINVFNSVGCDGFLLRVNFLTKELSGYVPEFVDNVVPILKREGYIQASYQPGTLRQRLGTTYPL